MSTAHDPSAPARAPKLLAQVRQAVRLRHFSPRTEESYVAWIRRYVRFHALRHPRELGAADVTRFLARRPCTASSSRSSRSRAPSSRYGCRSSWTGTRSGCSCRASSGHRGSPRS